MLREHATHKTITARVTLNPSAKGVCVGVSIVWLLSVSHFHIFKKEESSSIPSTMGHLSKIWISFAEEICLFPPLIHMSVCISLDVELYIYFIQLLCLRLHYRRQRLSIKSTTAIKDLQWYPSSSLHFKKYDIKKAHQLVL